MSNKSGVILPPPSPKIAHIIKACNELPLLDIGDYLAGKPGAMEQLAADIRAVHQNLGFMAIVNHGVDQAIIDAAVEQVRKVFSFPREELEKYKKVDHMQGYWGPETVRNVRPGFEKESTYESTGQGWVILRDREPNDPKVVKNMRHRAMNKWPDPESLPDFKAAINRYHQAMVALGMKLLKVYSLALGQQPDYLNKYFTDPEWYGRLNFYPAPTGQKTGALPLSAHSDHSLITLLPMSTVSGLQVHAPNQDWIDAPYVPGAIIVNGGEWLGQLSNGKFLATPHRVRENTAERISMPLFFDPNDEAVNDPAPGMLEPGEERKFPHMTWHEFFVNFIDAYTKVK